VRRAADAKARQHSAPLVAMLADTLASSGSATGPVSVVDVGAGRVGYPAVVAHPGGEEVSSEIGPVIAWQPTR